MSDPYKKAKAGRLTFKGGDLAAVKSIDKKKKKKKNKSKEEMENPSSDVDGDVASGFEHQGDGEAEEGGAAADVGDVYTIDAAKRMKYEELFPVETKKFGYDPANKSRSVSRSVEEALDDRVKKKADRYCK